MLANGSMKRQVLFQVYRKEETASHKALWDFLFLTCKNNSDSIKKKLMSTVRNKGWSKTHKLRWDKARIGWLGQHVRTCIKGLKIK